MSFSTQPNEMLDMILNQTGIPLPQRMRLRAVSHRFRATLEDGLQQESSLFIHVVSPSDLEELKSRNPKVQPNCLIIRVSNFTKKKAIAFIQRLFPRLTDLTISSDSLTAWRKATELLGHYDRTLTSLKVEGYLKNLSTRESVIRSLSEAINSTVNLSSLYLTNGNFFGPLLLYMASTLSRLERFTFEKAALPNETTLIATSLSSHCTHLHLNLDNSVTTFPLRDSLNLTHLHLDYSNDTVLQFVPQLPQLTSLILYDNKWPHLDTLLRKIHPLSQVTQLTITGINFRRPFEPPASNAFTFPSIKRLTLQMDGIYFYGAQFNARHYLQTLAVWFPKLETCSLYVHEGNREGILAIEEGLPYSIKLLDHWETTFE